MTGELIADLPITVAATTDNLGRSQPLPDASVPQMICYCTAGDR